MELTAAIEFDIRDVNDQPAAFRDSFEQVDVAEESGFHSIWLAERHFQPQRSVLSSPIVVAAAIANRTERVRVGIAVQVLPLNHPIRIAEEAATVDQISQAGSTSALTAAAYIATAATSSLLGKPGPLLGVPGSYPEGLDHRRVQLRRRVLQLP